MAKRAGLRAPISVEEYLRMEEKSDIRHEYVAGEIYAMSGGTVNHNVITINVVAALRTASHKSGCEVFINDIKVHAAHDVFYYPDVLVACGPLDGKAVFVDGPCLVVEVTSPSSFRTDRREKMTAYRAMPSLQSYLVIDQDERFVEHHSRHADSEWQLTRFTGNETISLHCPPTTLAMDAIYDRVEFPTAAERLRVREEAALYG